MSFRAALAESTRFLDLAVRRSGSQAIAVDTKACQSCANLHARVQTAAILRLREVRHSAAVHAAASAAGTPTTPEAAAAHSASLAAMTRLVLRAAHLAGYRPVSMAESEALQDLRMDFALSTSSATSTAVPMLLLTDGQPYPSTAETPPWCTHTLALRRGWGSDIIPGFWYGDKIDLLITRAVGSLADVSASAARAALAAALRPPLYAVRTAVQAGRRAMEFALQLLAEHELLEQLALRSAQNAAAEKLQAQQAAAARAAAERRAAELSEVRAAVLASPEPSAVPSLTALPASAWKAWLWRVRLFSPAYEDVVLLHAGIAPTPLRTHMATRRAQLWQRVADWRESAATTAKRVRVVVQQASEQLAYYWGLDASGTAPRHQDGHGDLRASETELTGLGITAEGLRTLWLESAAAVAQTRSEPAGPHKPTEAASTSRGATLRELAQQGAHPLELELYDDGKLGAGVSGMPAGTERADLRLAHYRDVPLRDVPMLFPGLQVHMKLSDKLRLAIVAGAGGYVGWKEIQRLQEAQAATIHHGSLRTAIAEHAHASAATLASWQDRLQYDTLAGGAGVASGALRAAADALQAMPTVDWRTMAVMASLFAIAMRLYWRAWVAQLAAHSRASEHARTHTFARGSASLLALLADAAAMELAAARTLLLAGAAHADAQGVLRVTSEQAAALKTEAQHLWVQCTAPGNQAVSTLLHGLPSTSDGGTRLQHTSVQVPTQTWQVAREHHAGAGEWVTVKSPGTSNPGPSQPCAQLGQLLPWGTAWSMLEQAGYIVVAEPPQHPAAAGSLAATPATTDLPGSP